MKFAKQKHKETEPDSEESSRRSYTNRQIWGELGGFIKPYSRIIWAACIGNIVIVVMDMMLPLFTKILIDAAIPAKNLLFAIGLGVGYFLLIFLRNRVRFGRSFLVQFSGASVVFDIRCRLFQHLQLLHLSFFEKQKSASLVNRIINDVAAVQQFITMAVMTIANAIFTLFFALLIVFFLNWRMALFCMVILPFYYFVMRYYQPRIKEESHRVRESQSKVAGTLGEVFNGIKVVKSFASEDWEMRRFTQMTRENIRPEIELSVRGLHMSAVLGGFNDFAVAGLFVGGAWAVMDAQMTIGDYVAFTSYLVFLFSPMEQLSALVEVSVNARTGFERIVDLLHICPQIRDNADALPLKTVRGEVEFDHVSFAYKDSVTIHDFHLSVKPGEMIAIVGPSGSGKSTMMNLLTRFHDVNEGAIRLDGCDIRNIKYQDYRRNIGIVLQENFLFAGTVGENIRYGKPDATLEEIREAAAKANAREFIDDFPQGFDAIVGERGVELSGGQRQRIAIARSLLKDPPILIFDEATSALDTISEHLIQEALYGLVNNRTVFVVAHRLSTIQRADRIVVLDRGHIVEVGSHEELLKKEGAYSRMFRVQKVEHPVDCRTA